MKRTFSFLLSIILCLVFFPSALAWEPMKRGDEGQNVVDLQKRLIALGYLPGEADGVFGKQTEKAVKSFQKQSGLSITGIVDETTLKKVKEHTAPYAPGHTPAPTLEPTPPPVIEDGYIFSPDRRIKVAREIRISELPQYNYYYIPTIRYVSVKSGAEKFFATDVYAKKLVDLANSDDMALGAACRATMVEQLTEGVYFLHYDIYFGEASLPYTQVLFPSSHFPDDFDDGDAINIQSGLSLVKKQLRNPNSMILRSVIATNYDDNGSILYEYTISAQNGFGGYSEAYIDVVYNGEYGIMQAFSSYNSWMKKKNLNSDTERQYSYQ